MITVSPTVSFYLTENCSFDRNTISHTGAYALASSSKNMEIRENKIYDAGAGGIKIGEAIQKDKFSCDENYNNKIINNEVYDNLIFDNKVYEIGKVYREGTAIWVLLNRNINISHNLIFNISYIGVSVGWRWSAGDTTCKDNIIEYNEIYNTMQKLHDGGGIYLLGKQPGTAIRNNKIHDILFTSNHLTYSHLYGIYLDQGSKDILIKNNLVYRTGDAGLNLHRTFDNLFENNIFIDGTINQLNYAGTHNFDPDIQIVPCCNNFTKNLIYYINSTSYLVKVAHGQNPSINCSDYNLYYNPNYAENPNWNFDWWRNTYNVDENSIIADPLFVDYENSDFSLQSNSPAFDLGFEEFDLSNVGPKVECFDDSDCGDGKKCVQRECVEICNNNGVCEAGETFENCPNDCAEEYINNWLNNIGEITQVEVTNNIYNWLRGL